VTYLSRFTQLDTLVFRLAGVVLPTDCHGIQTKRHSQGALTLSRVTQVLDAIATAVRGWRQPSATIFDRIQAFRVKRKSAPPSYCRPAVDDETEAD
jgi:hypothetical protein